MIPERHDMMNGLDKVEKNAKSSKFFRLLNDPISYCYAILFREVFYKLHKTPVLKTANTFFGKPMKVLLPSSTDIFITGGKSHHSEIRLAKYLIQNLPKDAVFVDVGAHYGYFTLLASMLVGTKGHVYAFEPSPATFKILSINAQNQGNISIVNKAVSNVREDIIFFEFPNQYSEYNSMNNNQFKNQSWYSKNKPKEFTIASEVLTDFLISNQINAEFIKIDVEGNEHNVLKGLEGYLMDHSPIIIMEYLLNEQSHYADAESSLKVMGYMPHIILDNGQADIVTNVKEYMEQCNSESDNIVFIRLNN